MPRRRLTRIATSFVAVVALLAIDGAHAIPTYVGAVAASDFGQTVRSGTTTTSPAAYLAGVSGNQATSVSGSAHGGTVESSATSALGGIATANTEIHYHVDLLGPANVYVPIRIMAAGFTEAAILATGSPYGSGFNASASFVVNFSNATEFRVFGSASAGVSGFGNSFVVDQVVRVLAGSFFDVDLIASANAGGSGLNPTFAHAFVDPVFTIDPAFAALYHLEGIPVVDVDQPPDQPPIGAVPEPAPVLLICAAFVGLGMRRRVFNKH